MDAGTWIAEYGLFGLMGFAFLAATFVPISSEVAVLAALQVGFSPGSVLLFATVGNCLGAMTNVAVGRAFSATTLIRLRRRSWGRQAVAWAQSYGGWSLAGSWLPLVGDPLMLMSGILRLPAVYIVVLGLGTRVLRYVVFISLLHDI